MARVTSAAPAGSGHARVISNAPFYALRHVDDGTVALDFTYDDAGRKLTEAVDYGPFQLAYTYTYYDNGLKETFTGPDAITYRYEYDEGKRLVQIEILAGGGSQGFVTYSEFDWNQPQKVAVPGGVTRFLQYDPLTRPMSIVAKDGDDSDPASPAANERMRFGYERYSPAGNLEVLRTDQGDYRYGYDDLSRLTRVKFPDTEAAGPAEAFTYDLVGNRKTRIDTVSEWAYNANNEIQGYDAVTFDHDANGNLTHKYVGGVLEMEFVYEVENRLVEVKDGAGATLATYGYDPFGRRLWKDVVSTGEKTYFAYSNQGLVAEYRSDGSLENFHRHFEPGMGRYYRVDPILDELNWYTYSGANPSLFFDPWGLDIWHINDRDAVGGNGHGGVIIGQPSGNSYTYHGFYSKNGTPTGPGDYRTQSFSTIGEALDYAARPQNLWVRSGTNRVPAPVLCRSGLA